MYYQRSWPGDWDLQHSKRPAANWNRGGSLRTVNEKDNVEDCGPTIKQPVARRALPDSTRSLDRSIPQHLPGKSNHQKQTMQMLLAWPATQERKLELGSSLHYHAITGDPIITWQLTNLQQHQALELLHGCRAFDGCQGSPRADGISVEWRGQRPCSQASC